MEPVMIRRSWHLHLVLIVVAILALVVNNVCGDLVFPVIHKWKGREAGATLSAFKVHDERRHARILASSSSEDEVDLLLGGNGQPSEVGLYYTKIGLGNPSKDYFVQVDTGSDILWVNCAECKECPAKSDIKGVNLTTYDPKSSPTSKMVNCDDPFCLATSPTKPAQIPNCRPNLQCQYSITYGDGSTTGGFFVKDDVQFQKVTGNFQTSSTNGSVIFGCGAKHSKELSASTLALSGLMGFGQANTSVLSQLSAAGKVKRQFAHCLDNTKQGGGIWAIGEVVEPKIKNTVPMVPKQMHYTAELMSVEAGNDVIELPTSVIDQIFGTNEGKNLAIFDSGTTLAYLPPEILDPLVKKILASESGLKLHTVEDQFTCFEYSKNIDDKFPVVKLNFKNNVSLTVYPRDYLFNLKEDAWCIGWIKAERGAKGQILLGDLVLSNKIVVYDLENQVLGWADHNCSSSIKVKDAQSSSEYSVGYHNLATNPSPPSSSPSSSSPSSSSSAPSLLMPPLVLLAAAAAIAVHQILPM